MAVMQTPTNQREENIQAKTQDMAERAKQVGERAKDVAGNIVDKTKDIAGNVVDKTKETAAALGHRAEDATRAVGQGMESLASTVRHNAPQSGMLGSAAASVASGLESSGRYLEKEGLQGIGEDLLNVIRRNPIPALIVGIGLGFVLARAVSPRA